MTYSDVLKEEGGEVRLGRLSNFNTQRNIQTNTIYLISIS